MVASERGRQLSDQLGESFGERNIYEAMCAFFSVSHMMFSPCVKPMLQQFIAADLYESHKSMSLSFV